jgi:arylformamidase
MSPEFVLTWYNHHMIYDVTVPITNTMPVWPSDPPVQLTPNSHLSRDKSHTVRLTAIAMGSHTGTHIDAPYHFVEGGRRLHEIPLEQLTGKATVLDIPAARSIARADVAQLKLDGVKRVLFKTENSRHWKDGKFYENFVYLEPEAAQLLVDRGIVLVGIDYLSIDKFKSETHPTHFVLLRKNIVILEGLDLSSVPAGEYDMTALPLHLQDADGAPTRVILTS